MSRRELIKKQLEQLEQNPHSPEEEVRRVRFFYASLVCSAREEGTSRSPPKNGISPFESLHTV